jgi:uncharacterized protein
MGTAITIAHGPMRAWRSLLAVALTLMSLAVPAAAQTFPALTGRVVDETGVLDATARAMLTSQLAAFEAQTGNQLVVATVKSLQGLPVETYANRLFRAWRLGHKDKNNGVLLLIAPADRKVRIEVGYGLEGVLPDAVAKVIIETALVPRLRAGHVDTAALAGVDEIIKVLTGRGDHMVRRAPPSSQPHVIELPSAVNFLAITLLGGLFLLFFAGMGYIMLGALVSTLVYWGVLPKRQDRTGFWRVLNPFDDGRKRGSTRHGSSEPAWASSSSSSSSSSSDSFSGGGGSSGGGGASGSW